VGKCLLAFAPEENREGMIGSILFDTFTEKTISSKQQMYAEIEKVRAQGYAIDDGELSADIKCIAVPVFDNSGACNYSLGTSGALSRMTEEKVERVIPLMLKTAKEIFA
jgi:DNA-binding IclR family transcriptional regulator